MSSRVKFFDDLNSRNRDGIDRLLIELCLFVMTKSTLPDSITKRLRTKKPLTDKQLQWVTECYREILKKRKSIAKKIERLVA